MADKGPTGTSPAAAPAAAPPAAAPAPAGATEGTVAPVVPITREPTRAELFKPVTDVRSAVDAMEKETPEAFAGLTKNNEDHLSELSGLSAAPDVKPPESEKTKEGEDEKPAEKKEDEAEGEKPKEEEKTDDAPKKPEEKKPEAATDTQVLKERAALSSRQVRLRHKELRVKTQEAEIQSARADIETRSAALDAREKEISSVVPASLPTDGLAAIAEFAQRTNSSPRAALRAIIERVSHGEGFPSVESLKPAAPKSQDLGPAGEELKALRAEIAEFKAERTTDRETKEKAEAAEERAGRVRAWETKGLEALKANPGEYKLLAKEMEKGREIAIRAEMVDVADRYIERTGVAPSQEEVLGYLESVRVETFEAWTGKPHESGDAPGSDNAETASGTAEGTSEAQKTPPPKAPRTTLNQDAAEQAPPAPANMTERERIAYASDAVPDNFQGWLHLQS